MSPKMKRARTPLLLKEGPGVVGYSPEIILKHDSNNKQQQLKQKKLNHQNSEFEQELPSFSRRGQGWLNKDQISGSTKIFR
jgi:hypothetical protein